MRTVAEIFEHMEFAYSQDENVCCCGDSMNHNAYMVGHTPVSLKWYTIHALWEEFWQTMALKKYHCGGDIQ